MVTLDLEQLKRSDVDASGGVRGWMRTIRRIANRCYVDRATINQPRVFCQNSGGCGSTYIVKLLKENGVQLAFHKKTPDLLEFGLQHFEAPIPQRRLIRILRYTRHDVYFEANNRLFSLSREIATAFPSSRFIYLYRDAAETVRSAMSKPELGKYLKTNPRFRGSLAGSHELPMFDRFCHHWANMNRRIFEDLKYVKTASNREVIKLKFEDLIAGNLKSVEAMLNRKMKIQSEPANIGRLGKSGKYPRFVDWSPKQKQIFENICGPVVELIDSPI